MPSSHLILWCPLLLLPSIFRSITDFSSESAVRISWPKYLSFSFSISPSKGSIQGWFPLRLTGLISLLPKGLWGVFSSTTVPSWVLLPPMVLNNLRGDGPYFWESQTGATTQPLRPGSPAPAPEPRLRTARRVFRELSYQPPSARLSTAGSLAVCLLACQALAGHHGLVLCLRHPSLHTPAGSPLSVFQGDTALTPSSAGGLSLLSGPEVPGRPGTWRSGSKSWASSRWESSNPEETARLPARAAGWVTN